VTTSTTFDVSDVRVVDADAHVAEPPDLWTSRVAKKWGDEVPHLVHDDRLGVARWLIGGRKLGDRWVDRPSTVLSPVGRGR
jgi:hypothetical protein